MEQINLKEAIDETKKMMDKQGYGYNSFAKYSLFYFHSNENAKMALENLEFNKNQALSVMASGDQVFNLISLGVKHIDAFDINILTYFIYHLRRAIYLVYGPEKGAIIENMFCSVEIDTIKLLKILTTLRPVLPDEVIAYFQEVLTYAHYLQTYHSENYFAYLSIILNRKGQNLYLSDFSRFQDNLEHAEVNFINSDIENLSGNLDRNYDLMYFSNIGECYVRNKKSQEFVDLLIRFYSHLSINGLMLNYFFSSHNLDSFKMDNPFFKDGIFNGAVKTRSEGQDYALLLQKKM